MTKKKTVAGLHVLRGLWYAVRVVKRTCTAAPRFLRYERGVMHMSNTELLSILLSIASLLLTLYFGLR